ncbi:response regulator [Pseudosulfitobacter pseudonitzschiae]|uniref:response regulator transcription factor n=1 Tax=Pseudosulfitobacter pseudonitzschiae TaxID=1402135 RepID=UPI003B7AB469
MKQDDRMIQKAPLSVLIADDHQVVTDLIGPYLAGRGNLSVHVAHDLADAIKACHQSGPFDVVLLDYFMPDMSGIDSIRKLIDINRPGRVALFSGIESQVVLIHAIKAGAYGLIPKSISARNIAEIISSIANGEIYYPVWYTNLDRQEQVRALSKRESEILGHLRGGLTNEEIAHICGISTGTVKLHVKSACTKLGVKNRTQAAMIAEDLKL